MGWNRSCNGALTMSSLLDDARFALRNLRRRPALPVLAILTLALGIGSTVAIWTLVDALLLRPLPFADAGELVRVVEVNPHGDDFSGAEADYLDFRARNRSLSGLGAYRPERLILAGPGSTAGAGEPVQVDAAAASASLFGVLGATPLAGRTFLAEEDRPGSEAPVALIGEGLWRRRFGADPGAIGRSILLDGVPHRLVGVVPARRALPVEAELWVPLAADPGARRNAHWLTLVGRLRRGTSRVQAQADLQAVAAQLAAEHPRTNAGWSVRVEGFRRWMVGPEVERRVLLLLAAVAFLLLVACANVANLLLAAGAGRSGELAVRAACGAGRGRLVRQLLTETAVLALLAGGLGLLLAGWLVDLLVALAPAGLTAVQPVAVDGRVAAFALALSLAAVFAAGLLPALGASRLAAARRLAGGQRVAGGEGRRLRTALVVAELALATSLLVVAGVAGGSFARLRSVDTGFAADGVLAAPLALPQSGVEDTEVQALVASLLARVGGLPGVTAVGATTTNPLRQYGFSNDVTPEEQAAEAPPGGLLQAGWRSVTPGFFRALGVPLLAGRAFTAADTADSPKVVVVSKTLAERLWPGRPAVGRRLFWGGVDGTPYTVVGVSGDLRDVRLDAAPPPLMFLPFDRVPVPQLTLLVRAPGAPGVAAAVREAVRQVAPELPPPSVTPLASNLSGAVAEPRFVTVLLACFAAATLLLAGVGIYGMLSTLVSRRRREIGVRLALGAAPRDVRRLVVRQGMAPAALGVALGLAGTLAVYRLLAAVFYQVGSSGAGAFAGAAAVLLTAAFLAVSVPARRAAQVASGEALRSE
jgi:putative ABC transport system permease protein